MFKRRHHRNGYKIKRVYSFYTRDNNIDFESIIKINFPGINGYNRKKMFQLSENLNLERFYKNYNDFKNCATTFEALSFFIEILLKHPGKIFVDSTFFKNKFILESKIGKNSKKLSIKMFIINNFIGKDQINFKENSEEEIFKEIKKLKRLKEKKNFQK